MNYYGGPDMYGGVAPDWRKSNVLGFYGMAARGHMMMQGGMMCELAGKKVCERDPS